MAKSDPIRERYFNAVEHAEKATDFFFYLAAILSFVSLLVDQAQQPALYRFVMVPFAATVVLLFAISAVSRMYFMPRADQKRRQDFLGHAFGVNLSHETTDGYYNTDLTEGPKRLAVQLLENSFFTKELTRRMTHWERAKLVAYAVTWIAIVAVRETNFGVILAVTQFVFSEQIIAKCIRVEWLRAKSDRVYEEVYRLLQSRPQARQFLPQALDAWTSYETAKATAGIVIPSKLFDKLNPKLSDEWQTIRTKLGV